MSALSPCAPIVAGAILVLWPLMAHARSMDCVVMRHGAVMLMKQGQPMIPLTHTMNLTDGSKVSPGGQLERPGGHTRHLRNGDIIMMDGHLMHGGPARAMQKQE